MNLATSTTAMALSEVIDVLRRVEADTKPIPTAAQVRLIVDDIANCVPLATTAARPELAAFGEIDILEIAEMLGSHRARVMKLLLPKPNPQPQEFSGLLFGGYSQADLMKARKLVNDGRKLPRKLAMIPPDVLDGSNIVLPTGYEKTARHGRDVGKSIRAVAVLPVEDAEIIRFIDRTYTVPGAELEADHVFALHWIASKGLSETLLDVAAVRLQDGDGGACLVPTGGDANIALAKLLVQAYDLLEVARADAMQALLTIVSGTVTLTELRSAIVNARWLAPGELGRLDKTAADVASKPEGSREREQLEGFLRKRIASLRLAMQASPGEYVIRRVEDLNVGHVTMIVTAAGLDSDAAEEKAVVAELRTQLTAMGLINDLDRELPAGVRAWRAGLLDEFYASRQARVDGDPNWQEIYETAAEAASSVREDTLVGAA